MLRWGTSGPQTDRRAAPGPTRAGGVWLVQIPPASRSPRLARGSRYSERGRGGSVPQLPQATPGCPQALARSLTSRAGLLRSRAFTPKVVPGARLDNRVRLASAVPPVRDEMGGAGRPGPVCGGMARDETFNRAAQPGASPRPARVEAGLAGQNRGRGPKGTPAAAVQPNCATYPTPSGRCPHLLSILTARRHGHVTVRLYPPIHATRNNCKALMTARYSAIEVDFRGLATPA